MFNVNFKMHKNNLLSKWNICKLIAAANFLPHVHEYVHEVAIPRKINTKIPCYTV